MVIFWEFRGSNIGLAGCRKRVKMWDDRNFNSGMQNKNTSGGTRLFILTGGMQHRFKIDGGMQDEKQKIAGYRRYAENCDSNQGGSRYTVNILTGAGLSQNQW